jgi:putative phage-type endonuclease
MLLSDLEDLENILDDIVADDMGNILTKEEECECVETCLQLMHDFIDNNPTAISEPDFEEDMLENVKEIMFMNFANNIFMPNIELEEELDDLIDIALDMFYLHFIPKRSYPYTFDTKQKNPQYVAERLTYLRNKPQPEQRTKEWYEFRHNLITASNAYKAFENDSTRNQLIYEKCQPLNSDMLEKPSAPVNVTSTLHWGQKFEPVSVMYYEHMYKTSVGDYGCIQHDKYHFLGASPDGIVSDPSANRFGRMLEIKNIINREIDGIPMKEYWIQMQLQMETCDLDECDFLECRFIEYETLSDFSEDGDFFRTSKGDFKGIIMYFSTSEGKPKYVYKPLMMPEEQFDTWEQQTIEKMETDGNIWIKNIYWKLEEVSCVLVLRNKKWFNDNINTLKELWDIVIKEREQGFIHRAPVKRTKKPDAGYTEPSSGCLININKNSGKISIIKSDQTYQEVPETNEVIKIRTESIDETKNNSSF